MKLPKTWNLVSLDETVGNTGLITPEFDVRKPAKNEYSKGLEAFLERAYILNKP